MKCRLIAKTLEEKVLGLSVIPKLGKGEYALFIYDLPTLVPYWNKGVKYPIDIGFYDKEKNLIYKTSMKADQRTAVYAPKLYTYVIETNIGELVPGVAF